MCACSGPVQLIAYADSLSSFSAKFGAKAKSLVLAQAKQTDPKSHVLPFVPSYPQARPPMATATATLLQRPTGVASLTNLPPAAPATQQRAKPAPASAQPPQQQQQQQPAAVPLSVPGPASHPAAVAPASVQRATPSGWPVLTPRPVAPPASPANPATGGVPALLSVSALAQRLGIGTGSASLGSVPAAPHQQSSGAAAPSAAAPAGPHQAGTSPAVRIADGPGGSGTPASSGAPTPFQTSTAQGLWNSLPQQMQQRLVATQPAPVRPGVAPAASLASRPDPSQAGTNPSVDLLTAASRFPLLAGQLGAAPMTQMAQSYQANLLAAFNAYQANQAARTMGSGATAPAAAQPRAASAAAGAVAGGISSTYVQLNPPGQQQQQQGRAAPSYQAVQQPRPALPAHQGQMALGYQHAQQQPSPPIAPQQGNVAMAYQHAQPQNSVRPSQQDQLTQAYQHVLQQNRANQPPHGNAGMAYHSAHQLAQPQQPQQYSAPASIAPQAFAYSNAGLAAMPPSSAGAVPPSANSLAVPLGTLAPARLPHASAAQALPPQSMYQHGGIARAADLGDGRGIGAMPMHPPGPPGQPSGWAPGQAASQPVPPDPQMWMGAAVGVGVDGQMGLGGDLADDDLDYDLPDDLF